MTLVNFFYALGPLYQLGPGPCPKSSTDKTHVKTKCLLNGYCRKEDVIHKCTALTTFQPKKVYLGLAEGGFKKQRYYNHTQSTPNHFKTRTI